MNKKIQLLEPGLKDYKEMWDQQEELFKEILDIKIKNRRQDLSVPTPNYLVLVEHPHVYTMGKSGVIDHLLLNEQQLNEKGAKYYKINREVISPIMVPGR